MKTVLLIGANGLVGRAIFNILKYIPSFRLVGTFNSREVEGLIRLNILELGTLKSVLEETEPDIIIYCPNFPGGVNRIESEKLKAKAFHLDPLVEVCMYCKKMGKKLVFFSTDYVFGNSEQKVLEEDSPSPLNYYGELKQISENLISESLEDYLIIRTTNVYGFDPYTNTPNFFMQAYTAINSENPVVVGEKQISTPTYVEDLSNQVIELINKRSTGVYHIVGDEYISRKEWAERIIRALGKDPSEFLEVKSFQGGVRRPNSLQLSNEKVKEATGLKFHTMEESLNEIKGQINNFCSKSR